MNANAEIIAELRRVLNERDEARRERDEARAACPDCAMWAERSARWHDDMQRAERERDEARADADRWKRSCNVFRERDWPKAFQATVTSLEREVSDAYEQLAKLRKLSKPWEGGAYQRGAEAMREACACVVEDADDGVPLQCLADDLRERPIPEEP